MNRKLTELIDSAATTSLGSVVHPIGVEKFTDKIQAGVDALGNMLIEHYTKEKVLEKIHEITDMETLLAFKAAIIPPSAMQDVAAHVDADEDYPENSETIRVLVYMEILKQLERGGSDYLRECLRQRMQVLAQQQAQGKIIQPKKSKIITDI